MRRPSSSVGVASGGGRGSPAARRRAKQIPTERRKAAWSGAPGLRRSATCEASQTVSTASRAADASSKGDLRVRATALPAAGEGRYWLELATASETGIASAARLLLHGTDFSAGGVERAILMLAGQQPIEVPPEYVGRGEARSAANA